jgi:hypothetical protein
MQMSSKGHDVSGIGSGLFKIHEANRLPSSFGPSQRQLPLVYVQAHFDAAVSAAGGSIRTARVAKRKGQDGKRLSAGFGFVECSSEEVAKIGISKMQVQMLYSAMLRDMLKPTFT